MLSHQRSSHSNRFGQPTMVSTLVFLCNMHLKISGWFSYKNKQTCPWPQIRARSVFSTVWCIMWRMGTLVLLFKIRSYIINELLACSTTPHPSFTRKPALDQVSIEYKKADIPFYNIQILFVLLFVYLFLRFSFFFFWDRVSLCRFGAYPGTQSGYQAVFKLTEISLPLLPDCWD